MHWLRQITVIMVVLQLFSRTLADYLLHTFTQKVGSGNYSYFKLSREGNIILVLQSIGGDADIYISDQTETPTFESYDFKSATCGDDTVEIPATLKRPVGIGVYGHPSQALSHFRLHVFLKDNKVRQGSSSLQSSHSPHHEAAFTTGKKDEESILWTIFVGILKIIFDILL